jgi:hypothetical protein
MADFKTPNLCGANESLNTALSKIDDIKAQIESKLNSSASEAAAAFETAQADIKSKLDALAVDLPEAKPVNLQSEITSLINDVDRTTAGGIAAFNAKVAALKKDFGGALEKKGLDFDKLIDDSSAKLGKDVAAVSTALDNAITDASGAVTDIYNSVTDSVSGAASSISSGLGISGVPGNVTPSLDAFGGAGDAVSGATSSVAAGGNLCDLVPNFELPADLAGTGVTTEEIEERASNAATLTLTQTPEEILEVTGKKTTQSFFTNIQHTVNGKVIVPKATGTYSEIKVKYTISKIAEKPIAAKQADKPAEAEEVSSITKNASAETKKTELKAKVEAVKSGEVFVKADPVKDVEPVVVEGGKTVEVTTTNKSVTVEPYVNPNNPNNLSREELRDIIQGKPKKRKTQSDKGLSRKVMKFMQRFVLKGSINEKIWDDRKHKVVDDITNIKLFRGPFKIEWVAAYIERSEADLSGELIKVKDRTKLIYTDGTRRRNIHSIIPEFTGKQLTLKDGPKELDILSATRVIVRYKYYSTIDPDYSG